MREILFRGKRVDNGEWIYGDLLQDRDLGQMMIEYFDYYTDENGRQRDYCQYDVIPETVGQYTGIPDGNNRKMYDGDICCFSILGNDETIVKISYRYGTPGFEPVFPEQVHPDDRKWEPFYREEGNHIWNPHYFRVIGNIHDNPEPPEGGSNGMEDLLNSEPAWRQSMTAQINVFVNEVAQKTEDLIVAKMTEHLTAHGYDKQIEINGANLRACIEKQIPKKPEKEAEDNLLCPACGGFLGYESECKEEPYQLPYCSGCGQAIDWVK